MKEIPRMKLHRLAANDELYILLAHAFGTDKYGQLAGFDTNPYGHLTYGYGSGDNFICGDFAVCPFHELFPKNVFEDYGKDHVVLVAHIARNSTGSIEDVAYDVHLVDISSTASIGAIASSVHDQWMSLAFDDVRHHGWNQDSGYFARAICKDLLELHIKRLEAGYTPAQRENYQKMVRSGNLRRQRTTPKLIRDIVQRKFQ